MSINPQLISVVIPTFGRNDALVEAIDCVRNQSYVHWEVIVVDDNESESQYRAINEAFFDGIDDDEQISYVRHEQNKGACAARNTGVSHAKGDIIAFYDDDDVWFDNKLQSQLQYLHKHDLDFTFCLMNEHYNGYRKVIEFSGKPHLFEALLKKGDGICTSAIMVKKHVAQNVSFDEELQSFQDFDYLLRLSKTFRGEVQQEVLMDYQISPLGISRNPRKKVQGLAQIINKFSEEYRLIDYPRGLAELHQKQADFNLLQDAYKLALMGYWRALTIKPLCVKGWVKLIAGALTGKWVLSWVISRKQQMQWQKMQGNGKRYPSV